jgi:hypothetical protein
MTIMVGAIIIPPIVLMIITALRAPVVVAGTIKGNALASDLMEEVLSKSWDENATAVGPISDGLKTLPASLGPESGETRPAFDDIDDYNGYSESPPKVQDGQVLADFAEFTRSVQVYYVRGGSSGDYTTQQSVVTNFKKIIIRVDSEGARNQLEAVMANR